MYDIIIEHKPQQKLMPWLFNQGLYHSRVSCKKCAAGVKQIDDTISDGGKHIPTYTIKRCDKTLLKRGWFRIPLDNVEIICECRNLPMTKTFGTMVKGINCSLYLKKTIIKQY